MICNLDECNVEIVSEYKCQKYCTKKHQVLAAQRRYAAKADKKVCEKCGIEYHPYDKRQRFCSRSCSSTATNPLKAVLRFCKRCGERLEGSEVTFCSRKCYNRTTRDTYISRWKAGKENGSRTDGSVSLRVRNYLLEQAGNRCASADCSVPGGWGVPNPVTGKPILTIDHVDGNWLNNTVDNLVVLCYNCHTLTPTFGSLNKNSPGNRPVSRRYAPMV